MSVVYQMSDKRELKIGSISVFISPLNYKVKSDMQMMISQGQYMDAAVLSLKNCIKDVKGLKLSDGSEYRLDFDPASQILSDDCINDLLNIEYSSSLNIIGYQLLNGMPTDNFKDPETGEVLEGVKFVEKKKTTRKK